MASQQGRRRSKNRRRTLLGYVEDSCELRTTLGVIFSILLMRWRQHRDDAQRAAGTTGNFHRQGDHVESLIRKIV